MGNWLFKSKQSRSKDERPKMVGWARTDQLIPYDQGEVPFDQVSSIIKVTGDFIIWTPVGQPPDPKSKCERYISVSWKGQVYHYPIHQKGDKVWITPDRKCTGIDELVCQSRLMNIAIDQNNPEVKLLNAVHHKLFSLRINGRLGSGKFGEVFKGQMTHNGKTSDVAVKRLEEDPDRPVTALRGEFLRETQVMRRLKHPNVVQLYCVTFGKKDMIILMELMEAGPLDDYLRRHQGFTSLALLLAFSLDACRGMAYLEERNCIHRALTARHCRVSKENQLKIAGFGLSWMREETRDRGKRGSSKPVITRFRWAAPESLRDRVYSHESDVWSYGVLLFEIFTEGKKPHAECRNGDDVLKKLAEGKGLKPPKLMSEAMLNVMIACQQPTPTDRPTFAELENTLSRFTVVPKDKKERKGSTGPGSDQKGSAQSDREEAPCSDPSASARKDGEH